MSRNTQLHAVAPLQSDLQDAPAIKDEDVRYLAALDRLIVELIDSNGTLDFAELSRSCLGAWPKLVADRIDGLGLWGQLARKPSSISLPTYSPELHCGFGEWYFSAETARSLADEFVSKRNFSLFLGTPTIAERALATGANFVLVDSNPFVRMRFPDLKEYIRYSTIEELRGEFPEPSTIVLDAPWYLPQILFWLARAARHAVKSTVIVMPLFPLLTRPAAARERSIILEFAERIGNVELISDCVTYDSPLYEWEALLSNNMPAHPNWRRADLLIIRQPSSVPLPQIDTPENQAIWETYLIGSQVIRLRLHPMSRQRKFLVSPIAGTNEYILDSVSARDERRKFIDVWTSRNRVAAVGNIRRIRYLLSICASLATHTAESVRTTLYSFVDPQDAHELSRILSLSTFH